MKRILSTSILILLFNFIQAQVYPYSENFDSMTPFTSPSGGWTSTVAGFQIYPNHGNASQGMTKQLSSFQLVDSVISPLIGPLNVTSYLQFDYRAVETSLYPTSAAILGAGDKIEIKVLSSGVLSTIYTIDQSNHTNSTSFVNKQILGALASFAGSNVKFIIKVSRSVSANDFYYDFDNFQVLTANGIEENNINAEKITVFPNPIHQGDEIRLKDFIPGIYNLRLMNAQGKVLFTETSSITEKISLTKCNKLALGIYYVSLQNDNKSYVLKFIVQ